MRLPIVRGSDDDFGVFIEKPAEPLRMPSNLRRTVTQLSLNINYCQLGNAGALIQSVCGLESLTYLRIWAEYIHNSKLQDLWSRCYLPKLKHAELLLGNFTRLLAVQHFIKRHASTLETLYVFVQSHIPSDYPEFAAFVRNDCKLQQLFIKMKSPCDNNLNTFDCALESGLRAMENMSEISFAPTNSGQKQRSRKRERQNRTR